MVRPKRVSIHDVAAAAGTSKSTASRALLGQAGVSDDVRQRVERAAIELGYVKDYGATSLRTDSFRTIGLFVRAISTEFYGLLAASISAEAEQAGFRVALATSSSTGTGSAGAIEYLRSLRSEAIIVASGRIHTDRLVEVAQHVPVVVAGCVSSPPGLTTVSDDGHGTVELVREVEAAGHRTVGVVVVRPEDSTTQGYRSSRLVEALEGAGCEVVAIPFDPASEQPEPTALRDALDRVSVVMCANDPVMIRTWELLTAWGLEVPADVSLTGYDGIGALASPALGLTTWRQPIREIGRTAAREAIQAIDRPWHRHHLRLRGELVPGRSLGPPRTHSLAGSVLAAPTSATS